MPSKSLTAQLQDLLEKQAEHAESSQQDELQSLIGKLSSINARAEQLKQQILKKRQLA